MLLGLLITAAVLVGFQVAPTDKKTQYASFYVYQGRGTNYMVFVKEDVEFQIRDLPSNTILQIPTQEKAVQSQQEITKALNEIAGAGYKIESHSADEHESWRITTFILSKSE